MAEVVFVLTLPAFWNDAARQLMREAATAAGYSSDTLIVNEPEAAAIQCLQVSARLLHILSSTAVSFRSCRSCLSAREAQ